MKPGLISRLGMTTNSQWLPIKTAVLRKSALGKDGKGHPWEIRPTVAGKFTLFHLPNLHQARCNRPPEKRRGGEQIKLPTDSDTLSNAYFSVLLSRHSCRKVNNIRVPGGAHNPKLAAYEQDVGGANSSPPQAPHPRFSRPYCSPVRSRSTLPRLHERTHRSNSSKVSAGAPCAYQDLAHAVDGVEVVVASWPSDVLQSASRKWTDHFSRS
jgi:hypothetical protein